MILKNIQKNSGFVILFAVVVSAILLSITLGIANIALKELKFTTSARETNDSFFAADTGIECALMNDKGSGSLFPVGGPASVLTCATAVPTYSGTAPVSGSGTGLYTFYINSLGSAGRNCAVVTVYKDGETTPSYVRTTITSKGYNIYDSGSPCTSTSTNRIERQLETRY